MGIGGTSGTAQIPESFNVATKDSSGEETIEENISPISINIAPRSSGDVGFRRSSSMTGADLAKSTQLETLMTQSVPCAKDMNISGLSQLKNPTPAGESFSNLEQKGCNALKSLTLSDSDT